MTGTTAVVLGGGGLSGIGWLTGVLAALEEHGELTLADAESVIGTSAGSATATAILQSGSAAAQFEIMVRKSRRNAELTPTADIPAVLEGFFELAGADLSDAERGRRYVKLSHTMSGADPAARRTAVASRLSSDVWPANLTVTAFREDGTLFAFTGESAVGLVDAVTASCAVPGLWPTVDIDGAEFVDGGCYSITNAHLAAAADRVIVLAPMPEDPATVRPEVAAVLNRAVVVSPSERSATNMGLNPFDPDVRGIAAVLGYEDGVAAADLVRR